MNLYFFWITFSCVASGLAAQVCSAQPARVVASSALNTEDKNDLKATPSALISIPQLAQRIADGETFRLIEVGAKRKLFDQGHIETAQYVDWIRDITDPEKHQLYNVAKQDAIEKLLSRLGVENDMTLVIYDRFNRRLATRMFWTLKVWGHQNVQVLDGGIALWKKQYSFTQEVEKVTPTTYKVTKPNRQLLSSQDSVLNSVKTANGLLVDGRPVEQFTGEKPGVVFHTGKAHKKRGHIPGAANIPWKANLNPDGTFKSAQELRKMYAEKGIVPGNSVITYCNEGLHAALPWFVLDEILEFDEVSIYDDSMAEWGNSERPVEMSEIRKEPSK